MEDRRWGVNGGPWAVARRPGNRLRVRERVLLLQRRLLPVACGQPEHDHLLLFAVQFECSDATLLGRRCQLQGAVSATTRRERRPGSLTGKKIPRRNWRFLRVKLLRSRSVGIYPYDTCFRKTFHSSRAG